MINRMRILPPVNSTELQDLDSLAVRAIASVLRHAQSGDLPLFAWTLGLPQEKLLAMIEICFPELGKLIPMPDCSYNVIRQSSPSEFIELSDFLLLHRTHGANEALCEWLSRAIAAAAFGNRHLWEDLGLSGRNSVSELLEKYFPNLFHKNIHHLKWKHFLFGEFGKSTGNPSMKPPGCNKCQQFKLCFPPTDGTKKNHA